MDEAIDKFNELATSAPDRGDEEEDIEINAPPSATQSEKMYPNETDLKTTLRMLNPTFEEPELQAVAPVIMQGRVFPDNFFTKVHLMTIASAKLNRHNKDFNYIFTMMKCEGMCQIGFEGKNRVETVIISGNAKEVAEQESNMNNRF